MRTNPLVTHTGEYIAQKNGSELWFHGSSCEFGAARRDKPLTEFIPDSSLNYQATFFSSKRSFAITFAEAGMPHGYDFGCVYAVKIKDVRLFDVDDIFVDMDLPDSPLTEEGEIFWQNMSKRLPRKGWFTRYKMQEIMHLFQGASFRAFDPNNTLTYSAMIETMRDLGYRGWVEYEGSTLNIALLYPHEDAIIVDSFIVGGSRANPEDYRIAHVAPDESDAPLWNVTANGIYPADFYGPRGLDYYGTGYPELDTEAYAIIRRAHGWRDRQVRIYRAVPKGVKKINVGDWVTTVRQYAKDHAVDLEGQGKDGVVISKLVNARDLFTDGNSMLEWGYDPQPFTKRSDREEWERWPGKVRSNPFEYGIDPYEISRVIDITSWSKNRIPGHIKYILVSDDGEGDEITSGEITVSQEWDRESSTYTIEEFIEDSNCSEAIIEQIYHHGIPRYIYSVVDARLVDTPPSMGFGEAMYLETFADIAENLGDTVLFLADECGSPNSTSDTAQGLWRKLQSFQNAKYPFTWHQHSRRNS